MMIIIIIIAMCKCVKYCVYIKIAPLMFKNSRQPIIVSLFICENDMYI